MRAEIIAVGSELLTPDHIDTNSLFITQKLNEAGFDVRYKTVVGDDDSDLALALRHALDRSKLIVFCGGLGPTEDDRTRTAVAGVLGRSLSVSREIVEVLRRRFANRGYSMPKINERQAELIEGAQVLPNPNGTAPGMWLEYEDRHIVLLPGPPRELKPMFERSVTPRLLEIAAGKRMVSRSLFVTGLTESEVDSRIASIYLGCAGVQTTVLASPGHIALHLREWLGPGDRTHVDELAEAIAATLGDAVFTMAGEPMESVVGRMLMEAGLSIAVAESCTAGMLGSYLTRLPGSSSYFRGGVLCYSNAVKISWCGVPAALIEAHGAVSPEVAVALAAGIRQKFGTSLGLAITGIAGPGGGSQDKPVGLVYVGVAGPGRTAHLRRSLPGDRETVRERSTYFALSSLRRFLLEGGAS